MSADVPAVSDNSAFHSARTYWTTRDERLPRIWNWWRRAQAPRQQPGPYEVFRAFLPRLSDADFERFMNVDPVVIDLDGALAAVTTIVRPNLPGRVPVIIINVHPGDLWDDSYTGLLAHETAHIVLEHLDWSKSLEEKHKEVARKLAEWGLTDVAFVAQPDEYHSLLVIKVALVSALTDLARDVGKCNVERVVVSIREAVKVVRELLHRHQAARICARPAPADEAPIRSGAADQPSVSPALGPTPGESSRREEGTR